MNQSSSQRIRYLYTIEADTYAPIIFSACEAFNPKRISMLVRAELEGKKIILYESEKSEIAHKMDMTDYCQPEMFLVC